MRFTKSSVLACTLSASTVLTVSTSAQASDALVTLQPQFLSLASDNAHAAVLDESLLTTRSAATSVTVQLPTGHVVAATRTGFTQIEPGRMTWTGELHDGDGASVGHAIFSVHSEHTAAVIIHHELGTFRLRATGTNATMTAAADQPEGTCGHCNHAHDSGSAPTAVDDSFPSLSAPAATSTDFTDGCDIDGPIDVYVAYTNGARTAAGGTPAMLAEIDLAIASTNTAYANSGITTPLRLVGTEEVNYAEPAGSSGGMTTMLNELRDPSDGILDGVHVSRDVAAADLVALVVNGTFGSTLGIANNPGSFSVNRWDRLSPTVFAHETGHNRGLGHQPSSNSVLPYGKAYRFSAGGQDRDTVMYSVASSRSIPHFSNPAVDFLGVPTGIANDRDNTRAANETEAVTRSYRCSSSACATLYTLGALDYNNSIGYGVSAGTSVVWMKQFNVQAGATELIQLNIGAGSFTTEPKEITVALWDDPNNDGDPSDATLIASYGPFFATDFTPMIVSLPPTAVGSVGDSFFVGATTIQQSGDFPYGHKSGEVDQGRSWTVFGADENNVPSAPSFNRFSIPFNLAITALGTNGVSADIAEPYGSVNLADVNAIPGSWDFIEIAEFLNAIETGCPN